MNTNENAITVKELRTLLFNVENQNMTVQELRTALFNLENQNSEVTADLLKGATK